MSIAEATIIHHIGIVLLVLWILSAFNSFSLLAYFISLIYLYQVHQRYVMRLKKKSHFEERREAYRRRVLSDSESVRWLNHTIERIWPVCMEHIISNKVLLPIIPWFLDKYKPWTVKKAMVQHLYMGRNPPVFTDMRVLHRTTDEDHLVLEIGMNFVTADDMSAILAVQLRKRLGFGMWAKLHMTGMHLEGKVLLGVKFLREWPFLGRLRLSFAEPPYFQLTVKPLSTHGLDVTEFPGVAGWLDKLLSTAFEQTLVEPNILVVDMEKFVSPDDKESWFSVHEKKAVGYAKVEVIEACDMKPSDLNGLADPYVKGKLGHYTFKTKIQWKTLSPKWFEEFKIPISTWDSSNTLTMEVCDKDHFVDDTLGGCSFSLSALKDGKGQRHDMWLPLENIKTGRLHLAITVFEPHAKVECGAPESTEELAKMADEMEPITIEGQEQTGVWVQHPGSHVSQTWEPRKGRSGSVTSTRVVVVEETSEGAAPPPLLHGTSLSEFGEKSDRRPRQLSSVRTSFRKIRSMFHGGHRGEDPRSGSTSSSPGPSSTQPHIVEPGSSTNTSETDSPARGGGGRAKDKAKGILNRARHMKHALSNRDSCAPLLTAHHPPPTGFSGEGESSGFLGKGNVDSAVAAELEEPGEMVMDNPGSCRMDAGEKDGVEVERGQVGNC